MASTSNGTIQGYKGVAAVDRKHQIVVEAQAFGEGQEHHTLKPILDGISCHYQNMGIDEDILAKQVIITADTGFSNEANYSYLRENGINAYIPDNKFRSRDKAFTKKKTKYGKRNQKGRTIAQKIIPASEFTFNKKKKTCICPAGRAMLLLKEEHVSEVKKKLLFEGRLTDCRAYSLKNQCMRNPDFAGSRKGHGRQVSFTWANGRTVTGWMKKRVDST
jgi:hypothetical protein